MPKGLGGSVSVAGKLYYYLVEQDGMVGYSYRSWSIWIYVSKYVLVLN